MEKPDFSLSMFWPDLTFVLKKVYQLIRSFFDPDYKFDYYNND